MIDIQKIRNQFPVLKQQVYGKPLVYLDSAASTQKNIDVLLAERQVTLDFYGNIHRAAHFMADKTTQVFEASRDLTAQFIHAGSREEIIFTKGTTESVNLAAFSFGEAFIREGDEIIVSEMEHHSNIVPWQMTAQRKGARIVRWDFNEKGELELPELKRLINSRTRLIAVCHVSNVLGTINPVKEIAGLAHASGVTVFVDGAQAVQHIAVDVQELDADFYAFSSHKMYGPNGVGVLYGKRELLDAIPPYQGGGEMISEVSFSGTTYNELPYKFEAGTPHITGVAGFGAALAFLSKTRFADIEKHEKMLLEMATEELSKIGGVTIYGTSPRKSGVISFNMKGIHPYDAGMLLDKMGIAVRTGHHCADPVMEHFGIPGTVRASFAIYNTPEEVDRFIAAMKKIKEILAV
ncbi:MAG: SufS family cysteine desulfurase [Bacteroidota bacterium]|jgi:cysteine desulfurase/selenocysteine lyase|nr:SufS family cysteine desulfurase [Bacteroidota bacterium]NLS98525.1 SufS family cysteine desulfurase [Bacteroidales bacterium]OQB80298.1 MAG: Cysteine desulfurase [Bacteroidetes bacterium ADurb.Bin123]HNZ69926.1 SufS family cysteine desulfurase [Prolixibacteraceae bacterium]HOC87611.1 SufS family cysteine desulfurase [Prolixibacteraceae bacterium]